MTTSSKPVWWSKHSAWHPYWRSYWELVFHSLRCRVCRDVLSGVFVETPPTKNSTKKHG